MSVFKAITICYCEKIFNLYQQQAGEKLYTGYEAELLVQRNDFARCLIKTIKELEVQDDDYPTYYKRILDIIHSTLKEVKAAVTENNIENKKKFTTDLFESSLTSNLISYINMLNNLFQKSPEFVKKIPNDSLFSNTRDIPWVNQFAFVLYEYILEKEFEIITTKIPRDIFDSKIQLILKYVENAAALDEHTPKYNEHIKTLLKEMYSEEQNLQCRTQDSGSPNSSSYASFASFLYKASEKVKGKSALGQKIDILIEEFNERAIMQVSQNI